MKLNGITKTTGIDYTTDAVRTVQADRSQAVTDFETDGFNTETVKSGVPAEGTVKQAVSDINKKINSNTIAEYGYDNDTNRVTIKIVDKTSDKVIKEYPAEETLDMIAKVWELAGMFLDERLGGSFMAIRLSGIASGLDTDSMVKELVSAYSIKKQKYDKQLQKQEWIMSKWSDVNKKVYGFYAGTLSSMRLSGEYGVKTTYISNQKWQQ